MKNVVLLAINAKYVHSSLAVWLMSAGIEQFGDEKYDVKIVEATIHHEVSEIAEKIYAHKPDYVGISTYIWNASMLPALLMTLRGKLPNVKVIMGGPEACYNCEYWLINGADYILGGEGEYTFPALLEKLDSCVEFGGKDKLILPVKPQYVTGMRTPDASISTADAVGASVVPIDPYTDEYFAHLGGRLAYLETSRGCPFTCAFCLSADYAVSFFPLDTVKEQILKLSKSGARTIKLVDRTFNCNAKRAHELFEYIISLDTPCCFHFEVAADLFDERTLKLLKAAPPGRIQFEAGLQSFYGPTLEASMRKTDSKKAERSIRSILKGGNIHLHIDLIAGLPYENLSEFKNSFDRAFSLRAHTLQLGFLKLLHGSELRRKAPELGIVFSASPPYEIISSPWLRPEDLEIIKLSENALQHTYNKGRFLASLEYVFSSEKMRAFDFFLMLGRAAPNHGTDLPEYATRIYRACEKLDGVDKDILLERMTYDWLSMVKGKNMPEILRNRDPRRSEISKIAEENLGRKIRRDEAVILESGVGMYVDSEAGNPVTGLYKVFIT